MSVEKHGSHKPTFTGLRGELETPWLHLLMFQCWHVGIRSFQVNQDHVNLRERERERRGPVTNPHSHHVRHTI